LIPSKQEKENLPVGWVWAPLGDIISPSKERLDPQTQGVPFVGLEHIEANTGRNIGHADSSSVRSTKTRFSAGDVLYGRLRPYLNKVCVPGFSGICSTDILVFRRSRSLDHRYLARFLLTSDFVRFASQNMSGVQHPRVSFQSIAKYRIPVAPLSEQHRIADMVEKLFTKMDFGFESLKKTKAQLKRYRQSLLKAAFEGKITEGWRKKHVGEVESASSLLIRLRESSTPHSGFEQSRESALRTAELFNLPDGWTWTELSPLLSEARYGTSAKCSSAVLGVPVLRIPNVRRGNIDFSDLKYAQINDNALEKLSLRNGDLLVIRTNGSRDLVGRSAVTKSMNGKFAFASYLIRLRPLISQTLPVYVNYYFQTDSARAFLMTRARTTAGQFNVNVAALGSLPLPLASLQEQALIVEKLDEMESSLDRVQTALANELGRGENLRQSILSVAFGGGLVPQDPGDEPAEKLVERIKIEGFGQGVTARQRKEKKEPIVDEKARLV